MLAKYKQHVENLESYVEDQDNDDDIIVPEHEDEEEDEEVNSVEAEKDTAEAVWSMLICEQNIE